MIYSKSRVKQVSLKSFSLVVVDAKITTIYVKYSWNELFLIYKTVKRIIFG